MNLQTDNQLPEPPPENVGWNGLLDASLDGLIEEWKRRARIAGRDGDLEEADIGKAYLRAKFWAYLTCAIELGKAIGKPIPIPDQLLNDQQISEILARHQTQPTLPCL